MCKLLVVMFFCLCSFQGIAGLNSEELLAGSKKMLEGDADSKYLDVLKKEIDGLASHSHAQSSLINFVGYFLIQKSQDDFQSFKEEIIQKIPSHDFSVVEQSNNHDHGIRKSFTVLSLSLISLRYQADGNSPSALKVNPRNINDSKQAAGSLSEQTSLTVQVPESGEDNEGEDDLTAEDKEIEMAMAIPEVDLDKAGKGREGDIAKDSVYYKVYHAAVKAQDNNVEGIKELHKLSFEKKPQELTESILKTMILAMMKSKSKSLNNYLKKIQDTYPGNDYLNFLKEEPFVVSCSKCKGEGHTSVKCPTCVDNGKCRSCKGSGRLIYKALGGKTENKVCPACKGTKKCATCNGTEKQKKDCRLCGTKGIRRVNGVVEGEYKKALQYLIDVTPKLAGDNGLYIGVGQNRLALARLEEARQKKRERDRKIAEAKRKKEEAQQRKAEKDKERREARLERDKQKQQQDEEEPGFVVVDKSSTIEEDLNYLLTYLNEFSGRDKRLQKRELFKKFEVKKDNGITQVKVQVGSDFTGITGDIKERIIDGCFHFAKDKARILGLGKKLVMKFFDGEKLLVTRKTE